MVNKKPLIRAWLSRCLLIYHSNNSRSPPSPASTKSFCAEKWMVMSQQITIKLRPHNSISNKINKYIMMTRTIRSTTMSMAKLITAKINSNMLTTVPKTISNTTNSNNNTMTTIIISIDMIRLRCHQVIDIF